MYEDGDVPRKNIDVMKEAMEAVKKAQPEDEEVNKNIFKAFVKRIFRRPRSRQLNERSKPSTTSIPLKLLLRRRKRRRTRSKKNHPRYFVN